MEKKQKTVREIREALKAIRRRPIPREKIEEFNRIVEKDDQYQREQEKQKDRSPRKIPRPPEVADT